MAKTKSVDVATGPENDSGPVRGVALGLAIPLGWAGAHRFYTGKNGTGFLQLITFGGFGLWWLYDLILVATGEFRDIDGRRLAKWGRGDPAPGRPGGGPSEDVEAIQTEVRELSERVDFLERMLAQARERGQVGPGR